jgi:hypothetical protein
MDEITNFVKVMYMSGSEDTSPSNFTCEGKTPPNTGMTYGTWVECQEYYKEQAEREAREKAEKKAREKAEKEALQKAEREARQKAEKAEREARQKAEKAEKEAREKEKAEREAREKAEREAREKAEREARQKAEREAREKAKKEAEGKKIVSRIKEPIALEIEKLQYATNKADINKRKALMKFNDDIWNNRGEIYDDKGKLDTIWKAATEKFNLTLPYPQGLLSEIDRISSEQKSGKNTESNTEVNKKGGYTKKRKPYKSRRRINKKPLHSKKRRRG